MVRQIADCLENLYSVLELKIKSYIKYMWWLYDYIIFYFVTDAKANQNGKLIIWPLISFRLGRCSRIRKVLFLLRDITKILSKCIMSTVYISYKCTIRNILLFNYVNRILPFKNNLLRQITYRYNQQVINLVTIFFNSWTY